MHMTGQCLTTEFSGRLNQLKTRRETLTAPLERLLYFNFGE